MGNKMTADELDRYLREQVLPFLDGGPVAAWDLDGTVRDSSQRRHVAHAVKRGEATWDDYYMRCADDVPIEGSVTLIRELKLTGGYSHVAVSGSSMCAMQLTQDWLLKHEVLLDAVVLRKDTDHRPNGDFKVFVLRAMQRLGIDVRMYFEDWGQVAEQVRQETGIPVIGINPFDCEEMSNLGKGL